MKSSSVGGASRQDVRPVKHETGIHAHMAYFLVLPAFALWLIVAALAVAIVKTVPRLASIYPYAWRVSVWATVGFVIANVALAVAVAVGFVAVDRYSAEPSAMRDAAQATLGVTAIVGPFIASALGWLAGAVFGLILAHRSLRHAVLAT